MCSVQIGVIEYGGGKRVVSKLIEYTGNTQILSICLAISGLCVCVLYESVIVYSTLSS